LPANQTIASAPESFDVVIIGEPCVWLLAHRGLMHTDPVLFALKDWPSYVIGTLTLAVMWLAAGH